MIGASSDGPSQATINYDTIEYGVIVDNPTSGGSSGDTTLNSGATGA